MVPKLVQLATESVCVCVCVCVCTYIEKLTGSNSSFTHSEHRYVEMKFYTNLKKGLFLFRFRI